MKNNKRFFIKVIMLILLIGVCFAPMVYAADTYVQKDTMALPVGEYNQRVDVSTVVIPLESVSEGNFKGSIGNVNVNMTEESGGFLGLGTERNITLTAPDGTEITGLNVVVSSPDGEHADTLPSEISSIGKLTYVEDVDGNGTPALKFELTNSKVFDGDDIYVTYTDANGVEQRMLVGKVGDDVHFNDQTFEVPNDINDVVQENQERANGFLDFLSDPIGTIASFIEEILVRLFLSIGDGIVYLVSRSVGEVVTTDALIFNKVTKLNINYWNKGESTAIKGILYDVVNKWYNVFFKIAVVVYMLVLVVAGIQVLLHSTAEKTAQYKEYIVSWVVGVAILCLFPYAMKYTVMLGETAVAAVGKGTITTTPARPTILEDSDAAMELFGEPEFVEEMISGTDSSRDIMMYVRAKAQESKKFILIVIYFILIGQMMVLLLMYYKRAFMIAFLITIFPLVAMTYAIDKMGDKKAQSFSIWFREFIVNVVVQVFHAVVYVVMVDASVNTFINSNGQKWLLMLISVLFLFQGEKILRSIFSVKSKANTIADLATTAATYTAMADLLKGGKKDSIASKQDAADVAAIDERSKSRASWGTGAVSATSAINATGDAVKAPSPSTQGSDNAGQYRDNDPDGVNPNGFDSSEALDNVTKSAMQHRMKNGLASRAAKLGINAAGGAVGATFGMAKGDADGKMAENMLKTGHLGTQVAKGLTTPLTGAINIAERRHDGNKLADRIRAGEFDEELNLDALTDMIPPNVNPDEIADKYGEDTQRIFREALAEAAKAGGRGGRAKAEAAYWNYIKDNTKK